MDVISKQMAEDFGLDRFFTGRPCVHGHVAERYVKGGACVACIVRNAKRWQARAGWRARVAAMRGNVPKPR